MNTNNKKIELSSNKRNAYIVINAEENKTTISRARSCSPLMINNSETEKNIAPISKLVALAVQENKKSTVLSVTSSNVTNTNVTNTKNNSAEKVQVGMDKYITVLKRGRSPKSSNIASTAKVPRDGNTNIPNFQNRFAVLQENEEELNLARSTKPPPIYLREKNSNALVKNLISLIGENAFYVTPIKRGDINETKIQVNQEINYRKIVSALETQNKSFYTYQLKSAKGLLIVIKGIDSCVDAEEVKKGLENAGYKVRNAINIKNREKVPQPMFRVELEPGDIRLKKNETHPIYSLKYLLHRRVTVEEPHKKAGPIQCLNCQEYGHTKTYCKLPTVCVVCGELHSTANCDKPKDDSNKKRCSNCNGNHTANYRGCPVYGHFKLSMTNKKNRVYVPPNSQVNSNFPQLAQPSSSQPSYAGILKSNETSAQKQSNSQLSYANILKSNQTTVPKPQPANASTSFNFSRIEALMETLIQTVNSFTTNMTCMMQEMLKMQSVLLQSVLNKP